MNTTRFVIVTLALLLVAACTPAQPATPAVPTPAPVAAVNAAASPCAGIQNSTVAVQPSGSKQWAQPEQVIDSTRTYCAILTTDKGRIVAELYAKAAPKHVNSFVFLARQGYYDGVTWHRVLPDFMAQTGDPTGTGMGGPGYQLPLEVNPTLKFDREGVFGMARTADPNSAGSQFFITFQAAPHLDPNPAQGSAGYTIFGQVVEGMNVLRSIRLRDPQANPAYLGDPLVSVRIVELPAS